MLATFWKIMAAVALVVSLLVAWAPIGAIAMQSVAGTQVREAAAHGAALPGGAFLVGQFLEVTGNTFFIALSVSILCLLISAPTAYAMSQGIRKGTSVLVLAVSFPAVVPAFVSGFTVLPYFEEVGLANSPIGVIFGQTTVLVPISFVFAWLGFSRIIPDVRDAARNMGTSQRQIIMLVELPIAAPFLLTAWILIFLLSWNEFAMSWFLGGFYSTISTWIYGKLGANLGREVYVFSLSVSAFTLALAGLAALIAARIR